MSAASRQRQRPFDQKAADECTKKAGQCKFYRNLGQPGTYKIDGALYRMDEKGTLRKVQPSKVKA